MDPTQLIGLGAIRVGTIYGFLFNLRSRSAVRDRRREMPCRAFFFAAIALATGLSQRAAAQEEQTSNLKQLEEQRTDNYAEQLETHLRKWLVEDYSHRADQAWNRGYGTLEAYLESVEPNRKRWQQVVRPPTLAKTGELQRRPHPPLAKLKGEWLKLPLGGLTAEGILVVPGDASPQRKVPLVIAQHGIGSSPERTFGVLDEGDHYHRYAAELVEAGIRRPGPAELEEFKEAHTHYEKLGYADRLVMDLHEGGHEPRVLTGIKFLSRWLVEMPVGATTRSPSETPGR